MRVSVAAEAVLSAVSVTEEGTYTKTSSLRPHTLVA
jgi:hypothetical protein